MQSLKDDISLLASVGEKRRIALNELNIFTVEDLLLHFPFRYEDIQVRDLQEIIDQDKVALKGVVMTQPVLSFYGRRKSRLAFRMAIGDAIIQVVFFNQHFLKDKIQVGTELAIYGKWEEKRHLLLGMKILGAAQQNQDHEAIYHTNKAIKQATLLSLIKQALEKYAPLLEEFLPAGLLNKYSLLSYREAVEQMHFPTSEDKLKKARERLIYQDLFLYQLRLAVLKAKRYKEAVPALLYDNQKLKDYIQTIPFSLTSAQKRVTNEICRDLRSPFDMNRLLQGDVGSGKTIVASIAIMAAFYGGYQSAIMVPTEILAQQHFETLANLFSSLPIRVALLTSSTKAKDKKEILEDLLTGKLDCVVGTHALIQEDVQFGKLGLVIVDEQHRFGVLQRQQLKDKAQLKNVLYMTATPIPRTLSMTVFGEMDVSTIDELPSGRQTIITRWAKESELDKVRDFIKKEVAKGRQAYVITPLIEESEALDVHNAQEVFERLQTYFGPSMQVGLLHGRMKASEKEAVMQAFKDNNFQVLVSTTVIEVGVNVPNATVMVIQDAERFGLAQLHQLRGRVGRGEKQSYCILVASPKTEQGKQRMHIMTQSHDGFYLSQKDLEMRGSGDLFGLKQSGLPDFACADIIRDAAVLVEAKSDADTWVLQQGDHLESEANRLLMDKAFVNIML